MGNNWRMVEVEVMEFRRLFRAVRFTDAVLEVRLCYIIISLFMDSTSGWTVRVDTRGGRAENKPLYALLTVVVAGTASMDSTGSVHHNSQEQCLLKIPLRVNGVRCTQRSRSIHIVTYNNHNVENDMAFSIFWRPPAPSSSLPFLTSLLTRYIYFFVASSFTATGYQEQQQQN